MALIHASGVSLNVTTMNVFTATENLTLLTCDPTASNETRQAGLFWLLHVLVEKKKIPLTTLLIAKAGPYFLLERTKFFSVEVLSLFSEFVVAKKLSRLLLNWGNRKK